MNIYIIFFSTLTIVSYLSFFIASDFKAIRQAKLSNSLYPSLTDIYLNKTKFNYYVQKYCSVHELNVTFGCLKALKEYDTSLPVFITGESKTIIYHTLWNFDFNSTISFRLAKLQIQSYLATQTLLHTKFFIWLPKKTQLLHEFKVNFKHYVQREVIQFKYLNVTNLCSHERFEPIKYLCLNLTFFDANIMKFLVLINYGGIFADFSVIFTRNLSPFWQTNFVYRHSWLREYTLSIIGINGGLENEIEELLERLFDKAIKKKSIKNMFHPFVIRKTISGYRDWDIFDNKYLQVYHSAIFDPIWLCNDGYLDRLNNFNNVCKFEDIFIEKKNSNLSDIISIGSFTFHIHFNKNRIHCIHNNSYFMALEKFYSNKLTHFK